MLRLFSAYAEVFPSHPPPFFLARAFLCLRRGVSFQTVPSWYKPDFSLPTQRCFQRFRKRLFKASLFSAYAEVFLNWSPCFAISPAFLCLRRGVSPGGRDAALKALFSLPTQRCFRSSFETSVRQPLFSAYAEVFPSPSRSAS